MTKQVIIQQPPRNKKRIDPEVTLQQLGRAAIMAISGLRSPAIIRNENGAPVAIQFWTSPNRYIEIHLGFDDCYIVYRFRKIVKGALFGSVVVEFEQHGVYADQLSEVAYQASCWQ